VPSNAENERYVVVGKRAADQALLVGFDHPDAPGLFQSEVRVHSLSWTGEPVVGERAARLRAGSATATRASPSASSPRARDAALVRFDAPQRALAPGQVLALLRGGPPPRRRQSTPSGRRKRERRGKRDQDHPHGAVDPVAALRNAPLTRSRVKNAETMQNHAIVVADIHRP
jgi:hypothetical protein